MFIKLRAIINVFANWNVFIGRKLSSVPNHSIVIFPVQTNIFYCGLAGILAIKAERKQKEKDIVSKIVEHYHTMKTNRIDKVLKHDIPPSDFLGPLEHIEEMESKLYVFKQDVSLQYALHQKALLDRVRDLAEEMNEFVSLEESIIETNAADFSTAGMEIISGRLIQLRDIVWGLKEDLLKNQDKIFGLIAKEALPSLEVFKRYNRINSLLNSLDRLEVRGRDSLGIQITLCLKDMQSFENSIGMIKESGLEDKFKQRLHNGDLINGSINHFAQTLTFTYKTASITGELGKNCRELRNTIRNDSILQFFIGLETGSDMYLAHTRWASVGAINESNCHPVNNYWTDSGESASQDSDRKKEYPYYGKGSWFINVALNGYVDNYQSLKNALLSQGVCIDHSVTTDTKIIPLQIEKHLYEGHSLLESFRRALCEFEGSHAIALQSNLEPDKVFLALRGSGQSLFVGLGTHQYIFASEVYGIVEETPYFIKMDGEKQRIPGDQSTQGQIFSLHNTGDGLKGIKALYYDGNPLELNRGNIHKAEITTRDIDRGEFPHFLIKEIYDAPQSIRKTLRGKYRISNDKNENPVLQMNLGQEVVPQKTRDALIQGTIRKIFVIGQGTAAVAGAAIAEAFSIYLRGSSIRIQARKATDLSGFCLEDDLSDALVIAVTQSGTTTDTNRAVTMASQRGAHLIAIVNRRQSDITTKAHGVFYTSDGRDIEMSVASTKAFYSQIVAGYVLALYIAQLLGSIPDELIAKELANLERVPTLMNRVIEIRENIKSAAFNLVRKKRYWAVVGSGTNKVAADEVRIKLSELCYKTISSDIIEDKKHIDLSAEPLILALTAGSPELVLEDIVKDVAIFKAHAAEVVVIADEGEERFKHVCESVIPVPKSTFPISVILNTLAGHLWGYYAACSLHDQATFFKDFRIKLVEIVSQHAKKGYSIYESLADKEFHKLFREFSCGYKEWRVNGLLTNLSVETATDLALLLKHAAGKLPIEDFWDDFEDKRVSSSPIDMLDICLGKAIDELSRPVDAIRHQAKTVTVGTSRKVEKLGGILFDSLKELNFSIENISSKHGLSLKRMNNAVSRINGFTLYRVNGLDEDDKPTESSTISIVRRGGISRSMKSRVEGSKVLMGTKKTIVRTGNVYAGGGKSDSASIIIIPLLGEGHKISNLLLLHVDFKENLSVAEKKLILGEKYNDIGNLINEYNLKWKDEYLDDFTIRFLLGEAVDVIADEIKKSLAVN